MEIRVLREDELVAASGLSRYVFDACLRNRMEFTQTIPFIENYIAEANLREMYQENKLVVWGAFEQEQLVGVGGIQTDGMITLLYVLPQYMGRNCGMNLLITMKEFAYHTLHLSRVIINATPAWTAGYFKKHGFVPINPPSSTRVPFVVMQAGSDKTQFQRKEKIKGLTIAGAILVCIGFATIVGAWFMMGYLL